MESRETLEYYMGKEWITTVIRDSIKTKSGLIDCWMAYHPTLPGCMAQGFTQESARENLVYARKEYLLVCIENDIPIP
jgi:predicted RNase H-like HicB family nuclease